MGNYQPQTYERKWIRSWEKDNLYRTKDAKNGKDKVYLLSMFPYPSGAGLHVGHVRIYTGADVMARYFRMCGQNVLQPMGWDAFGLPTENAAIKEKRNPKDLTVENIAVFKRQMQMMGFSFDWDREFSTTDPDYYRWTQWIFLQLYSIKNKRGERLIYRSKAPINWCPKCKTGLANEEVLTDGTHERCGSKTSEKLLPQWIFRITDYADRLVDDLKDLDWPKGILQMQKNWVGKSDGIEIEYSIVLVDDLPSLSTELASFDELRIARNFLNLENRGLVRSSLAQTSSRIAQSNHILKIETDSTFGQYSVLEEKITCFTTRPDTNFGATFIAIAPENEIVAKLKSQILKVKKTSQKSKLQERYDLLCKYIEEAKKKSKEERIAVNREKTGVFTGFYAVNNLNGRLLPIWVSDFVVGDVGTGAVVGVPGADKRDFEFAKKHDLPIIRVVVGNDGDKSEIARVDQVQESIFTEASVNGAGTMINSDFLDGMPTEKAKEKIMDYLQKKGWGRRVTNYHLRDWIFSRQRYWGEPFPLVYCKKCGDENGVVPVFEEDLPVKLPILKSYQPTDTGESPLSRAKDWVYTKCPKCGGDARRETDTMPNWAGSCWYFLYFAAKAGPVSLFPQASQKAPFGGPPSSTPAFSNIEFTNVWKSIIQENGKKWLPVDWYFGGAEHAVLHLLYSRFWIKALHDLGLLDMTEPFAKLRNVGMVMAEDSRKMSKSFGNVINPDSIVKKFGADTLRIYEMFMAPFDGEVAWSAQALQGAHRFLSRIWQIFISSAYITEDKKEEDKILSSKLQSTILKVSSDITNVKFNTAISAMMEFLNCWEGKSEKTQNSNVKTQNYNLNAKSRKLNTESAKKFLKLLAPFAPFITEEIWHQGFGETRSIHLSDWPEVDKSAILGGKLKIPVQVNGKVRDVIEVEPGADSQEQVVKIALQSEKIKKWIGEREYKTIYIPGKILNIIFT